MGCLVYHIWLPQQDGLGMVVGVAVGVGGRHGGGRWVGTVMGGWRLVMVFFYLDAFVKAWLPFSCVHTRITKAFIAKF